jgi:hypothetical protein
LASGSSGITCDTSGDAVRDVVRYARNGLGYAVWHPDYGWVGAGEVVALVGACPFGFVEVVGDTGAASSDGSGASVDGG